MAPPSPQLAVFAPTAIVATALNGFFVVFRLAAYAQPHARNRLSARFRYRLVTFHTLNQAFSARQLITGTAYRVLNGCIYLFLYCAVFCESASHCDYSNNQLSVSWIVPGKSSAAGDTSVAKLTRAERLTFAVRAWVSR
jgi:hypothetical protein